MKYKYTITVIVDRPSEIGGLLRATIPMIEEYPDGTHWDVLSNTTENSVDWRSTVIKTPKPSAKKTVIRR